MAIGDDTIFSLTVLTLLIGIGAFIVLANIRSRRAHTSAYAEMARRFAGNYSEGKHVFETRVEAAVDGIAVSLFVYREPRSRRSRLLTCASAPAPLGYACRSAPSALVPLVVNGAPTGDSAYDSTFAVTGTDPLWTPRVFDDEIRKRHTELPEATIEVHDGRVDVMDPGLIVDVARLDRLVRLAAAVSRSALSGRS